MTMSDVKLYAYKQGSESSKVLADALGIKRLKHSGSTWNGDGIVINWGSSKTLPYPRILNQPAHVAMCVNKSLFMQWMTFNDVTCIPEWTDDPEIASLWLTEGHTVVCRSKLNGHSGEGITLVTGQSETLPEVPLYTKYQKKTHEYRVHIVDGSVIDVQQKKRKKDVPDDQVDWQVRNLAGGFIYAREGVVSPEPVLDAARESFEASGLDFGAVDVIWHEPTGKAVVLEINTAPGIQSPTLLEKYASALKQKINEIGG